MPETFAVVGTWLGSLGEGAAVAEGVGAAGAAAGVGTAATEIGAAEILAAGSGAAYGVAGAEGLGLAAGAAGAADVAGLTALDSAAYGAGGDSFLSSGGWAGLAGDGPGSLASMFSSLGGFFGANGSGRGAMQVLSSLYSLDQSKKMQRAGQPQGMTKAGLDAVMRGMAAQGYQGSGNMMAALERYGAETNRGDPQMQQAGLQGQMSSLGLLTAGLPKLFGWGDDSGKGK